MKDQKNRGQQQSPDQATIGGQGMGQGRGMNPGEGSKTKPGQGETRPRKGDLEPDDADLDAEGLEAIDEAFNGAPAGQNNKNR